MAAAALALGGAGASGAAAQIFIDDPGFQKGPIEPTDPLVGLPIPGATPDEYRAHLMWNVRSGLNVAALQCQFSPYLRAVDTYNSVLAHHARELTDAYRTLGGYFKRVHGAKQGQVLFDRYSTTTYNNFSTMHAQLGFCQTAADIAKDALTRPKGGFYGLARERLRELRSSLVPYYARPVPYNPYTVPLPAPPPVAREDCWTKGNLLKASCVAATALTRR